MKNPDSWQYSDEGWLDHQISLEILYDGYRKIIDQSFSESNDLGDMLRFLPGVVVQQPLSMQGMVDLYRIKPSFWERLIKSNMGLLIPIQHGLFIRYTLDDYLSDLLRTPGRSQLYHCDSKLQYISICRQFLSLLDQSNVFDLRS